MAIPAFLRKRSRRAFICHFRSILERRKKRIGSWPACPNSRALFNRSINLLKPTLSDASSIHLNGQLMHVTPPVTCTISQLLSDKCLNSFLTSAGSRPRPRLGGQ
jgi:hypothetical protein